MAVKLRLRRMGRKQHPIFSLVATDARSPRDGRFIEDLGRYEPVADPAVVRLNDDRILYWLGVGAQPSDTVRNLLSREGIMLRLHMSRKGKTQEEIEEAVAAFKEKVSTTKPAKKTAAERRAEALEAERKAAAEIAKKLEEERKAKEAELEAQRQEAEAAERAAREAADAESAAAAAAAAPSGDDAAAEATEEAVAESAPDAAEEQPAVADATTEEVAADAGEAVAEQTDAAAEEQPAAEEAPAEEPVAEATPEEAAPAPEAAAPAEAPVEEAAPAADAKADDLTKIWGIGPVFAGHLNNAGVNSFAELAALDLEKLRAIVNESGTSAASANEESWAKQAQFAADGDKAGLEAYIEELKNA